MIKIWCLNNKTERRWWLKYCHCCCCLCHPSLGTYLWNRIVDRAFIKLPSLPSRWDAAEALPDERGLENAPNSTPPCLAEMSSSLLVAVFSTVVAPPSPSIRKVVGMRSARKMSFKSNWIKESLDGDPIDLSKEISRSTNIAINFHILATCHWRGVNETD